MSYHLLNKLYNHPLASDATAVPTTRAQGARQQRLRQEWANVGLCPDIVRPYRGVTAPSEPSDAGVDDGDDWPQQSYCCP